MIILTFEVSNEMISVIIDKYNIFFKTRLFGEKLRAFDELPLSYNHAIKEFPDLRNSPHWRREAIDRYKIRINLMKSEEEISDFIVADFKKDGFSLLAKQKNGHNSEVIR